MTIKQTSRLRARLAASVFIVPGLMITPSIGTQSAWAQASSFEDEVIVTARRRAESIRDVPGSITAITAQTLQEAGVERVEDFVGLTPGVTLVNAAEAGDTQVNIRGINGARDAENSFALVIDGVLYTNPAALNREYVNLQQIEVFKGPQGAIYGRNAAAGAIIVTTERPDEVTDGSLFFSAAEDQSILVKGGLSGAISDNVFVGVAVDYRTTDGFYENSFLNAPQDAFESFNINGRLVWEPTEDFSLDLKARHGDISANSIIFNSNFHLPVFAAGTNTPAANLDVNELEFLFQNNIESDNDQSAFEASAKFDWDLGEMTLTGWALYSDIENNLIADGTSGAFGFYATDPVCQQSVASFNAQGFPLPSPTFFGQTPNGVIFDPNGSFLGAYTPSTCDGIQEQLRNQSDLSAELRLTSNTEGPLSWMVGAYALDIDREVGVSLNRDSGSLPPNRGLYQPSGPNRTDQLLWDDFDSRVLAVFGSIDYALSDTVELSAALRFDSEKREVSSLVPTDARQSIIDLDFDGVFNDPLNPGLSSLVNPAGIIPDSEETFEQLQPKLSATWDVSPNATLFASWGVGFKAGGFNNSGSAATINLFNNNLIRNVSGVDFEQQLGVSLPVIEDSYDKETSSAFEAGFRSDFLDGRVKLNGAAYYTEVDDMQFFEFFVGGFGLLRVVSNIDEVELMGVELGAEARVTDWLDLYAGFNYIDSEIKANASRPDTVGNKSPYTPDYTANFGGDVTWPVTDALDFKLRLDGQLIGPTWFHTVQEGDRATIFNPLFELGFGPGAGALGTGNFSNAQRDDYLLLNMRAGFQGGQWSLMGFVNNLTDEDYLEEVIPAPEFGGSFLAPGTQSRYGIEIGYRF